MPNTSGAVNLGDIQGSLTVEQTERLQQMAAEHGVKPGEEEPTPVHTAFTVFVNEGQVSVIQYEGTAFVLDHHPSTDEVYAASSVVQKDLLAAETAQHTVGIMQQQAMRAQQQMQAQRTLQDIGPNLRG